jgi:hypothetical protein
MDSHKKDLIFFLLSKYQIPLFEKRDFCSFSSFLFFYASFSFFFSKRDRLISSHKNVLKMC